MVYEYSDLSENSRQAEMTDCPECESDRTSYVYSECGKEIRKCHDCDSYFEVEEE